MDDKAQSIAELLVARGYVQADDLERVALVLSQAQAAPKAESVQSVEDIVEEICLLSTSGYMREQAAKLIAAPRQAGREEAEKAVRGAIKSDWRQPGMSLIRVCRVIDKALSDLDALKEAPHAADLHERGGTSKRDHHGYA